MFGTILHCFHCFYHFSLERMLKKLYMTKKMHKKCKKMMCNYVNEEKVKYFRRQEDIMFQIRGPIK